MFALDYGRRSDVSPPFDQIGGVIPIEESAAQLAEFVDAVLQATGAERVDIVGHSEGSLMPNYFVKFLGGDAMVDDYIGLTPLWDGTDLAAAGTLSELGRPSGLTALFEEALFAQTCQSCPQFMRGSSFLQQMNEGPTGPRVPGVTYTSGFMDGATNIVIQDQCVNDISEHAAVAVDPVVLQNILTALDPANPTPINCGLVLTYLQP